MVKGGIFVTQYAKQAGLSVDLLMLAIETYDLGRQGSIPLYVIAHDPKLNQNECVECHEPFWPARKTAQFCSSRCGSAYRRDQQYFGGRRRQTSGWAESMCGLCLRTVTSGLSSHHIFGKANDPQNEHLLALCKGCHQAVSMLALKKWVSDTQALERLIVLAISQAQGASLVPSGCEVSVSVDVELSKRPTLIGS